MNDRSTAAHLRSWSLRAAMSGALAGAISALLFTYLHGVFISDIWFSLPLMLAAGAACGACLSWSYALMVETPAIGSWLGYNLAYLTMFVLLGIVSVVVYEPITTVAEVLAADQPPRELFRAAMPMTVVFTLASIVLLSRIYGRNWGHYAAIAVTATLLVLLLGSNVALIGLVFIPRGAMYLVVELLWLTSVLAAVFAASWVGLEWRRLVRAPRTEQAAA